MKDNLELTTAIPTIPHSPAPLPEAGQVWIKLDNDRDQDTIVAVQPTTLPGVELVFWGARSQVHTLVDPEAANATDFPYGGVGHRESWPPAGRSLRTGPRAPWPAIETSPCPHCGHGQLPLDGQQHVCAGCNAVVSWNGPTMAGLSNIRG